MGAAQPARRDALMLISDRIYGAQEIGEPLLLDLLGSAAVQRLHGVLQHGISGLVGITRDTTRFEHSVGVMLLVRRLGAPLEEQAAALLHDISHTAFSHVIDYVFGGHDSQSYHDEKRAEFVAGSDLPGILRRHGLDWCELLCKDDDEQARDHPLLEQPAPALCADRMDYFLRDALDLGLAALPEILAALDDLTVCQRRMAAGSLETARWIGNTYMAADEASWANFREVGLYELTAQAIRRAFDVGALTEADLWGTDLPAWQKMHASPDGELQGLLELVSADTQFIWDAVNPTFSVSTKLRTVDPDVCHGGALTPLSTLDGEFSQRRRRYLESKAGKWPMRVVAGDEWDPNG